MARLSAFGGVWIVGWDDLLTTCARGQAPAFSGEKGYGMFSPGCIVAGSGGGWGVWESAVGTYLT